MLFENRDPKPRLRQIGRADQAVVPTADDEDVALFLLGHEGTRQIHLDGQFTVPGPASKAHGTSCFQFPTGLTRVAKIYIKQSDIGMFSVDYMT